MFHTQLPTLKLIVAMDVIMKDSEEKSSNRSERDCLDVDEFAYNLVLERMIRDRGRRKVDKMSCEVEGKEVKRS